MRNLAKTITWITLFAIAMGFLETAVVVYLRKIYYPGGFRFPLIPIESSIANIETLRELATVIMLIGIGILTGTNKLARFAWFIYAFAIWDIFYYVFLKIFIDWPESIFTWDILFLIPVPWVGPVIAPCIIALTMIAFALMVLYYQSKKQKVIIAIPEISLLLIGTIICIYSFCMDYLNYSSGSSEMAGARLFENIKTYVPQHFNWFIFWSGEILIIAGIAWFRWRTVINQFNK
jgi:hypothetical protein